MAWSSTHEELLKRLNHEIDDFASEMVKHGRMEIYDRADEISAMRFCYNQLAGNLFEYQEQELEPLLQYEKPLEVICRRWLCEQDCDLSGKFERIFRGTGDLEEQSRPEDLAMN